MKRTPIFGALFLAVLALCACGGNDEFVYKPADASWLSSEQLEMKTGEEGELCSPRVIVTRGCYPDGDADDAITESLPKEGCSTDRTKKLLCLKNAQGEWRYTVQEACLPYSLCVIFKREAYWDCLPYGGTSMEISSECEAVCQKGSPPCTVTFPSLFFATDDADNCAKEREELSASCLAQSTAPGGVLEDGAAWPMPKADCPQEILTPFLATYSKASTNCNRCVKWDTMTLTCVDGFWRW